MYFFDNWPDVLGTEIHKKEQRDWMYNYFCAPTARYAQCLLINAANTDMQTPNKLRSTTPLRSGLSKTIIHTHTYTEWNAWTISVWLHGNCKWSTHWEPHTEHMNKCSARRWHYTYYTDIDQCIRISSYVFWYILWTRAINAGFHHIAAIFSVSTFWIHHTNLLSMRPQYSSLIIIVFNTLLIGWLSFFVVVVVSRLVFWSLPSGSDHCYFHFIINLTSCLDSISLICFIRNLCMRFMRLIKNHALDFSIWVWNCW